MSNEVHMWMWICEMYCMTVNWWDDISEISMRSSPDEEFIIKIFTRIFRINKKKEIKEMKGG